MNRQDAQQYLHCLPQYARVHDLYDSDAEFRMALSQLIPGFEYPDVSHLSVKQLLAISEKERK